ncbi:MAG: hypothetical protein WBP45_15185 [Daejeonella sp.]
MKNRLEDFIKENKKEFDYFELPVNLWDKIEAKLDESTVIKPKTERVVKLSFLLKVAATVVVILSAAFWFYQYQTKEALELSNINPQLAKEQVYYASLIEIKRSELKRIEKEEPQLFREFSAEIKKMDESYQRLKSDLPNSPNQEETVKAMIRNLQTQTEVLTQQLNIIQQINESKKEQKNGTQTI